MTLLRLWREARNNKCAKSQQNRRALRYNRFESAYHKRAKVIEPPRTDSPRLEGPARRGKGVGLSAVGIKRSKRAPDDARYFTDLALGT